MDSRIAALACVLGAQACGTAQECRIGADCLSGACGADGRCLPLAAQSSTTTTSGGHGGSSTASTVSTAVGSGGSTGGCAPDGDGVVTQAEVPLAAGLSGKFLAAEDVSVDTAGAPQDDGSRFWDLSQPLAGDHLVVLETLSLDGRWFAPIFPGASYAARLSQREELLGVFEIAPGALLLRGVVSPEDGLARTELVYDPPVAVLSFPLAESKSWQADTVVSGLASGIGAFYTESYSYAVDAHGELSTPYGDFPVVRVHAELVRTVGLVVTTVQSHAFVAECFGPVAAVVSHEGELEASFSSAAEVRRLSP